MGIESSSLQCVESLNDTLDRIENRLLTIEDLYLHHDASFTLNDNLSISGKSIICNPSVNLILGPVIGLVTSSSIRLMVEVDCDSMVEFHIFQSDEIFARKRHFGSFQQYARKGDPLVVTLRDLKSLSSYCIYIGGIKREQALKYVARVTTLSDDLQNVKFLFMRQGKVDNAQIGEKDMWKEVYDKVIDLRPKYMAVLFHCGNLFSLKDYVYTRVVDIVHNFSYDGFDSDHFMYQLRSLELLVTNAYKTVLTIEQFRDIARCCSCLLIAGEGETFQDLYDVFCNENSMAETLLNRNSGDINNSIAGNSLKVERSEMLQHAINANGDKGECKLLLLGCISRIFRRVYWNYFRQLWDEDIKLSIEEDRKKEQHMINILAIKRKLSLHESISTAFEIQKKLILGNNSSLFSQLSAQFSETLETIHSLKQELLQESILTSDQSITNKEVSLGRIVFLNECAALAMIDAGWGFISVDGAVRWPLPKSMDLNDDFYQSLESTLHSANLRAIIVVGLQLLPELNESTTNSMVYGKITRRRELSLSEADGNRLTSLFCYWKSLSRDHAVMIVGNGNSLTSVSGVTRCYDNDPPADVQMQKLESFDLILRSNEYKSAIQCLSLGFYDHFQSTIKSRFVALHQILSNADTPAIESRPMFYSMVNYNILTIRRCFWVVECNHESDPEVSLQSDSGVIAGVPAYFAFSIIDDLRGNQPKVITTIIKSITTDSATIVIEIAETAYLNVICVDCVSGTEYLICLYCVGMTPSSFHFNHLSANEYYDIYHHSVDSGNYLGSFTTNRRLFLIPSRAVADTLESSDPIRIIILGGLNLNWHSDALLGHRKTVDNYSTNLVHACKLLDELNVILSQGWNGIDLVIHSSSCVDWTVSIMKAFKFLEKAEQFVKNNEAHDDYVFQMRNAEDELRNAVRILFGGHSTMKTLLSNGSHNFFCDPYVEISLAFNSLSFQAVQREFSSFSVQKIMEMVLKIQSEYLTDPSDKKSNFRLWEQSGVGFFELHLSWDGNYHSNQNLLSSVLLESLEKILFHDYKDTLSTLILISPIPIIKNQDNYNSKEDFNNVDIVDVCYSNTDVIRLLDICHSWFEKSTQSSRDVIMICGSQTVNFTSIIEVYEPSIGATQNLRHDDNTEETPSVNLMPKHFIAKQICCSSLLGTIFPTDIRATTSIVSAVSHRHYVCKHRNEENSIQFGLVEIAIDKRVDTSRLSFATCNELTLWKLKFLRDTSMISRDRLIENETCHLWSERVSRLFRLGNDPADDEIFADFPMYSEISNMFDQLFKIEEISIDEVFRYAYSRSLFSNVCNGTITVERCVRLVIAKLFSLCQHFKVVKPPSSQIIRLAWEEMCNSKAEPSNINVELQVGEMLTNNKLYFKDFIKSILVGQLCCEYSVFCRGK